MTIGVLALQGDFARHRQALARCGVRSVEVRRPEQLADVDGLVVPGGESTTLLKLMDAWGFAPALRRFHDEGKPLFGTCAGLILLARDVEPRQPSLGLIDVGVERNAYGRQIDSFSAPVESPVVGGEFPGVFIRAPRIRRVAGGVEVIARRKDGSDAGEPVGVRSGRIVGLCFHPELTSDLRFHHWFLTAVAGLSLPAAQPEAVAQRRREEPA